MSADTPALPPVLVRKYGGSSLASVARIRTVAADLRRARDEGYALVVVVSAMGATTDELAELARQASPTPPRRELDMLLSVGERITMSLLSMALDDAGCPAISFTGSQCGIITDTSHTDARILEVKGDRVREALARGYAVVVAGFQGVSREKEITTLGRGGSDTTAVALAAALGAVRCEILKDVDGVMTADPGQVPDAVRHEQLSWEEMRDLAASGCGVVHLRAVEYAEQHQVPLVVRSSFHDGPGTVVGPGPARAAARAGVPAPAPRAACDRDVRYRPLVMHVRENAARLRLVVDDNAEGRRLRDAVLCRWDPAGAVAEWLDAGPGFRWEVVAKAADLAPLRDALAAEAGVAADYDDGMTCVSLAGGRPDSWLEVLRHVARVLEGLEVPPWRLRADGSALRILFSGTLAPAARQALHRALIRG
ncbi:MAG TPA: aspartate kinase [Candidatus Krumholzibacteria bacterium]|nr:aspartate kinase [Candidatus Krumholzibacteria bacterium]